MTEPVNPIIGFVALREIDREREREREIPSVSRCVCWDDNILSPDLSLPPLNNSLFLTCFSSHFQNNEIV